MSARNFSPMLTRRAAPGAAKPAARPAGGVRPARAAAATGVPRYAVAGRQAPGISQRNDRWEGEARRVSETAARPGAVQAAAAVPTPRAAGAGVSPAVAATTTPTPTTRPAGPAETARTPASTGPPSAARASPPAARAAPRAHHPPATAHLPHGPPPTGTPSRVLESSPLPEVGGIGQPLSPALRRRLENLLATDLAAVRIHTGPAAARAADRVKARAFTVGNHIYLNRGESPADVALIAHETAHAVQQNATLNAAFPRGPPQSGLTGQSLTPAPNGMIQRESSTDDEPGVLDSIGSALGGAADTVKGAVVEGFWYAVDTFAPQEIADLLHQVRDEGFWGLLKKKISGAIDFVFSALKAQGGTTAKIATFFETLVEKAKPIIGALAAGDCQPLFEAVKSLGDMVGKMAGDAWDKITEFLTPIGEWLSNVWQKFGAPVVDFLKDFASDTWDWIQDIGKRLWDLTKPVRDFYSGAWTEIKKLLGFNEGGDEDGSGGLVGFIKEKAGEVWDGLKEELSPVIEPIKKAAKAVNDILPLGAILNLRETITEWLDKATAMADNMDQPDDVAENQDLLRDIVLPGIKRAITNLRGKVSSAQTWVNEAIGGLTTKVTDFLGGLAGNTLLSPFSGALEWLSTEATELGTLATEKVAGVFANVDLALVTLEGWIEPVLNMLKKLVDALGNLMGLLGDLVLGPLLLVPQCIRDPIKDFIVTRILSQIPVFAQLVQLPDIWAKIQPAFRAIIVQVFRDGNLFGAAWTFFKTVLSLLGVPPQLVTNLIRNAAKAIKDVLRDPVGFLGNVLEAMKLGLLQFVDNIGKHLLDGAVNWLLSGVKGPQIKIPDPFAITLRNVLDLVLQVLDLTKEKIFQRIEKKKGKEVADKVRKMVAVGEKVIEWVSILFTQGPAALWSHLKDQLSNLWNTLLNMVIDYLIGKIVQQATIWVTKTLASGGLSVIIDAVKAVYDALQVIAQYLKQLLEVANSVCEGISDIAKGVLNKGADMVESAAARLIPAVLAFLARTLGIGDLPVVIGEGIQKVRKTVEDAIDKLIEKTFAAVDWLKQKGKEAINKLKEWWQAREEFTTESGEQHAIEIEGEDAAAKVVVRSDLLGLDAAVDRVEANDQCPGTQKTKARKLHGSITTTITAMKGKPIGKRDETDPAYKELKKLNAQIRADFREITPIFAKYLFSGSDELPESEMSFSNNGNKATSANIVKLSAKRKMGSIPGGADPCGWQAIVAAGLTERAPSYVRLHLINENFGGLGEDRNLVAGPTLHNNLHRRGVEEPIKNIVGPTPNQTKFKGVVWMTASVAYHSSDGGQWSPTIKAIPKLKVSDFAESISVTWGLHEKKGNGWVKSQAVGSYHLGPMPVPDFKAKDAAKLKAVL